MKKTTCLLLILFMSPIFAVKITDSGSLRKSSTIFNKVAHIAQPSVVSISTLTTVRGGYTQSPFERDPFFQEFFGYRQGPQSREGLGSGVIISEFGHILTNHHVVDSADQITITLSDGREFDATIVGSDKKTDLALLKINGKKLPAITLANSDQLQIGDWAIAIGNPFGLQGTVTVGIISATGRSGVLDANTYADFIQTDAAINPGNSGGALLNSKGELIGINTAIFSQSGGYMGIGFAIPVNMAKRVMEDLIKFGRVKRGLLGVTIQPITDEIMDEFDLDSREGAFVVDIKEGSSADNAGIKAKDIILKLGGKKVHDYLSLRTRISELKLGEKSSIEVLRSGRKKTLSFTLIGEPDIQENSSKVDFLGLSVLDITTQTKEAFRLDSRQNQGVIIGSVEKNSLASRYRLSPGQVIISINRGPLYSKEDYLRAIQGRSTLLMTISDDGYEFSVVIKKR